MLVNLEIVTDVQNIIRRDFTLADKQDVNPTNPNCIIDGEFVSLTLDYKITRALAGTLGFAVWAEKGRVDVQAIGKLTTLFAGSYEADTRVFTSAGLVLGGPLSISASVDGPPTGTTRSGLIASPGGIVIGYVTRMPANNGGKLRFLRTFG